MKPETLNFITQYSQNRDPQESVESLVYLCSMLWLCRSDKIGQDSIIHLVDITNAAIEKSPELEDLNPISYNEKAYRLGNDVYFQNHGHEDIKIEVAKILKDIILPKTETVKKMTLLEKLKRFF